MTSEQANIQDKKTEELQSIYRKISIDFVANKNKIDKEDLILMSCVACLSVIFLLVVLSGWTGFYN